MKKLYTIIFLNLDGQEILKEQSWDQPKVIEDKKSRIVKIKFKNIMGESLTIYPNKKTMMVVKSDKVKTR